AERLHEVGARGDAREEDHAEGEDDAARDARADELHVGEEVGPEVLEREPDHPWEGEVDRAHLADLPERDRREEREADADPGRPRLEEVVRVPPPLRAGERRRPERAEADEDVERALERRVERRRVSLRLPLRAVEEPGDPRREL